MNTDNTNTTQNDDLNGFGIDPNTGEVVKPNTNQAGSHNLPSEIAGTTSGNPGATQTSDIASTGSFDTGETDDLSKSSEEEDQQYSQDGVSLEIPHGTHVGDIQQDSGNFKYMDKAPSGQNVDGGADLEMDSLESVEGNNETQGVNPGDAYEMGDETGYISELDDESASQAE